jgi:FkbM family methyltransferase
LQLSYAQRLEDIHLARVFAGEPPGFYVDVGAGHPVADNVTYLAYLDGWSGLVVEPQRALADLYPHVRPRDVVVTDLVGAAPGAVEFHEVERLHGFSTTVAAHAEAAAAVGAKVRRERRAVSTLAALLAAHAPQSIDVLKIDVEGAETAVLAGNDWTRFRPRVVVVEAVAPGTMAPAWEGWEPDLLARAYRFAFFDGLNRFYVADEAGRLAARFPAEPLSWDSVAHLWDFGRAPENPGHPDHALALALTQGLLAELPKLDGALIARLAARGGGVAPPADDAGRAALARIASAYDGGQLME